MSPPKTKTKHNLSPIKRVQMDVVYIVLSKLNIHINDMIIIFS